MARTRELSETGLYHITSRGVGKIIIFEDDGDRNYYLELIRRYSRQLNVLVLAWALMDDHVHLIVDMQECVLPSEFMRKTNTAYATHFNWKTCRNGHVFQGAFGSSPIKTDAQLMATVDYVHRNPERAGISSMSAYRWSSFKEYLGRSCIADTSRVLSLFGSAENMMLFTARQEDVVLPIDVRPHYTDAEVVALAVSLAEAGTSGSLRSLQRRKRDETIVSLYGMKVSSRQIARVFGIGQTTVMRILNGTNGAKGDT